MATINGTSRGDEIDGTNGGDDINGLGGNDSIIGYGGDDLIRGGDGDDDLFGGNGDIGYAYQGAGDVVYGEGGDDTLSAGRMFGGTGNDTYFLYSGTEQVVEAAGEGDDDYVILYNVGSDTPPAADIRLSANVENLAIQTDWNDIAAYGNSLDNLITGGKLTTFDGGYLTSDVSLYGLDGDDRLSAWEGDDTLDGGAGDDVMFQNLGNDTYIGGSGIDTLVAHRFGATIDLSITGPRNVGDYRQSFEGIENLIGSNYADTLIGNASDNFIQGGFGADRLSGGAGIDTVSYDGNGAVRVDLAAGYADDGRSRDRIGNFENVLGSAYNDTIVGNDLNNVIDGGAGNDAIDGGAGFDRASYASAGAGVTVTLARGDLQQTGGGGADRLTQIEALEGSDYTDFLTGNANNNVLIGGGSNDRLTGGLGDDALIGGDGFDTAVYADATSAVTVNLTSGFATGGAGADRLTGIEGVAGSRFGDRLVGSGALNVLDGGEGSDVLTGGAGQDRFDFTATLGSANVDTITDFVAADDTMRLGQGVFAGLDKGVLAAGAFRAGAVALDADDRILYNAATGSVSFDRDGSGTAYQAVAFARIGTNLTLSANDFLVI